jgi:hypothetical protein
MGDRKGNFLLQVLVVEMDELVGLERLGWVVGLERVGLEWCDHWFEPRQQLHNETGFAEQSSGGIGMQHLVEMHCMSWRSVAGRQLHLAGLDHLAADHTADRRSFGTHCAVGQPYSKKNSRLGQMRRRSVVELEIEPAGLGSLRTEFGPLGLVD